MNAKSWFYKAILNTIFACIVLLLFISLSPDGAIRLSVFLHGYPIEAACLSTANVTNGDLDYVEINSDTTERPNNARIYIITKHVPKERGTEVNLKNWIVFQYGIFYIANYYGYG